MKKIFNIIFLLVFLLSMSTSVVFAINAADCPSGFDNSCASCTANQTCQISRANQLCYCVNNNTGGNNNTNNANGDWQGIIKNPITAGSLSTPGGGLITFLNNVLRLIFVVAGIYALIQIVLAGFGFISAGADPKAIEKSWNMIWQSILGLIIIVGSLALAALIGLLLFGDAGAILNPKIYGPGG